MARKLESGRIEFGLQQRQADDTWGERELPRVRFFPFASVGIGRWLASSPLTLPTGEVRIVARKLERWRVEFGLQQRSVDDTWGDRQLPQVRFFPTGATIGRWLASSPLILRTSRPADSDAGVTDDDQFAQFVQQDIVEVTDPHPWWSRPRGNLLVHVHLCIEQGNEHLAKGELIDAYVRELNETQAPFYTWQSSGLLNVSFTAGTITIANDVASRWDRGYLPDSCTRSLTDEAHIGHLVILAGNPEQVSCFGWGERFGPLHAWFLPNAANLTVADIKRELPLIASGSSHGLDHNIGVHHMDRDFFSTDTWGSRTMFSSLEALETRRAADRDARWGRGGELLGTLSGFPAALQQQEGFQGGFQVLPCDFLESQGWPVGPSKPACFREPPGPAEDLRVDWLADGRPRVTWQPPSAGIGDPITGYTILVSTVTFDSRGHPSGYSINPAEVGYSIDSNDSVIFGLDLPADPRSFVLPRSPIGGHEYQLGDTFAVTVIAQSAVGRGSLAYAYASVGFPQSEIRIEDVSFGCTANCGPREFDVSWPSSDLVDRWRVFHGEYLVRSTPDGPIYYRLREYHAIAQSSNSVRLREGFELIQGQSYDVTVFGCLKDYSRPYTDLIDNRCFPYAAATITPETWGTSVHTAADDVSQRRLTISLGEDAGYHGFMCNPDEPCRSVSVTLTGFPSGPENPGPHEFACYVSYGSPDSASVAGTATYENLGDSPWTVEVCAVTPMPGGSVYVELDNVRSNTITFDR